MQGFIDCLSLRVAAGKCRDLRPEAAVLCLMNQDCVVNAKYGVMFVSGGDKIFLAGGDALVALACIAFMRLVK
jgi:hypothetical protein